jgi:aconitase A
LWRFDKLIARCGKWNERPRSACPSSPDNVVAVRQVANKAIYQAYVGSSANPGLRDLAIAALIVNGKQVDDRVSFDVNPTSRQILENLIELGLLGKLLHAGARLHQAGCNGCIGMGQAPATGKISLRTVPRNFPGRSGTKEDQIYLCSPEVATASALAGVITDPRSLAMPYPRFVEPEHILLNAEMMLPPLADGSKVELEKGPNIQPLPELDPLPEKLEGPVLLKVQDNISTDEIMPAGSRVLPFRSNIPAISRFVFSQIDEEYVQRTEANGRKPSFVVAGKNYGQGSSREHAAIAPRYLGVRAVLAVGFARIHWHNLINFGILPLTFSDFLDWKAFEQGDSLYFPNLKDQLQHGSLVEVINRRTGQKHHLVHHISSRQLEMILVGGLINLARERVAARFTGRGGGGIA